ncbi:helicase-associated domain-containing protein [Catenulispora pinisilvae]|uniref:helicase-associated domain-containing protein n=1 Tax=Catenulispora pinisilvae TaxID=2705253 RepID=UPI001891292B|nr:helicase-associated domain-containing protein [Catenulispora pinisilvae]
MSGQTAGAVTAARLRALGGDGLATLLRRRSDAVTDPVPGSLTELAERLDTAASVTAALRRVDLMTLQVAEAVAALGGTVRRPALENLLGITSDPSPSALDRVLSGLAADMLMDPGSGALTPVLAGAWARPLGLGTPAADLYASRTAEDLKAFARAAGLRVGTRKSEVLADVVATFIDPDTVRAVASRLPQPTQELLRRIADGEEIHEYTYYSPRYNRPQRPVDHAIACGLVVRADWDSGLRMCAEVALALRAGYTAPFDHAEPALERTLVAPSTVADGALAAAGAFVRSVAALLDHCSRAKVAALKSGGIGTREIAKLVKTLRCSEDEVRLTLALSHAAGLLALDGGQAAPTSGYDHWLTLDPAERHAALGAAWWSLPTVPLATTGAWNPAETEPAPGSALRRALMSLVADHNEAGEASGDNDTATATALADDTALPAAAAWQFPLLAGPREQATARAGACWREAQLLGAVAAGALTGLGRALQSGTDPATALAGLESARGTARLQADLTAVVTGTPSSALSELLDSCADLETRGTASIWRFSPSSVRRALDTGDSELSLRQRLSAIADGGLPQPLEYLIDDIARRHGTVRAQAVACCLRSDDTALLAEIAAERRLRGLGLRLLAPTVLASDQPLDQTLAALRTAGFAPLSEAADGTPIIERVQARRAPAKPKAAKVVSLRSARAQVPEPRQASRPPSPTDPSVLAKQLLAGPDFALTAPNPILHAVSGHARDLTTAEAKILAHAIDNHLPVTIEYVNRQGGTSTRTIENIQLAGGSALLAWCRLRQDERWFNLDRILTVEPTATQT